ncbi:hypothetical protein RM53_12055 [Brevundimonas nasdae]|uniref:Uncharacterized protein n=1 Tax=Brevundimonas nasdae TaxID=172043 RepID=A0A0B4DQI2_9CAUL|nr:hypothetical protein [Brevundimonas nasdae]KIC56523.1 hypothetical protein RM53_12055 [Brevundimonas nasdae]
MMWRPFGVDETAKQIVDLIHLLLQDPLASLDTPVGCLQRLQTNDRFDLLFGTFVFAQGEAVGALMFGAEFVF